MPLILGMFGCTTYKNGVSQEIYINTSGVDGTACLLESKEHKYEMMAPGKIDVDRSPYNITITCRKAGYFDSIQTIKSNFEAESTLVGNTYNGFFLGLAYDMGTRSPYEYPSVVIMDMRRDPNRIVMPVTEKYKLGLKRAPVSMNVDAVDDTYTPANAVENNKTETYEVLHKSTTK